MSFQVNLRLELVAARMGDRVIADKLLELIHANEHMTAVTQEMRDKQGSVRGGPPSLCPFVPAILPFLHPLVLPPFCPPPSIPPSFHPCRQ